MLSGISVICFAASYTLALLLELSRLFVRLSVRTWVMVGCAAAGFFAHTVFLLYYFRWPEGDAAVRLNWYSGCLLLAWVLTLTYLLVYAISRRPTAGLLLLPSSVVMILVAHVFPRTDREIQIWNALHGFSLAFGMAMVVIGFMAGLMYLYQSYRLKHKLPPRGPSWLPSLERLERINERCLLASIGLLGLGLTSGILLNLVRRGSGLVVPWSDPVVIASLVWLSWLFVVILFHALYRPARQGRKIAYMTVASFLLLGVVLGIMRWIPTQHGGPGNGSTPGHTAELTRASPRSDAESIGRLDR